MASFALCLMLMGCYSTKTMDSPNPTSYVFNADIEQIKNSIKQAEANQLRWYSLYFSDKERDYCDYIFKDSKNVNDVVLHSLKNVESKIYFRCGKPLYYYANFHIHLDSISENKTQVEIFTLGPEIVVFGIGYWSIGYTQMKKVLPSTIEEYEILLAIGNQLGEVGMPKCNYPPEWLKYKAKQQEQIRKQNNKCQ